MISQLKLWYHSMMSYMYIMWCKFISHVMSHMIWKNECDITYDVSLFCLWFHMWYHSIFLWYHIIVISHYDITMWHHMWYTATSHDIHIWHHIWYHSSKCDIIVRLWYHIIMISQSENHDITYDIIVWCRLGVNMIS